MLLSSDVNNIADAIPVYFSRDGDELVQIYRDDSDFDGPGAFYVTIPIPALDNDSDNMTAPVAFEMISRSELNMSADIRAALLSSCRVFWVEHVWT